MSNSTPIAALDITGTVSASDAIQLGSSNLTCAASIAGALRYSTGNVEYCNGSSWSTMTSGSSTLTGAGNNGYAAIWTGATTLTTDSALYVSRTAHNVGIGTSSPGAYTSLQVAGRGLFTGGSYDPGDSSPAGVSIAFASSVGFIQSMQTGVSNYPLRLQPNGGDLTINGSGNGGYVGIGTTTPAYVLDVTGNVNVSNTNPYIIQYEGGAGTNMHRWDTHPTAGILYMRAVNDAFSAANSYMEVSRTGGSYGIASVAFPNGNVGIGTTAPASALQVTGGTNILTLKGTGGNAFVNAITSASTGNFTFGTDNGSGAGNNAFIIYDNINSAYRFALNNSGNVGIGTTAPGNGPTALPVTTKLHVYGSGGSGVVVQDFEQLRADGSGRRGGRQPVTHRWGRDVRTAGVEPEQQRWGAFLPAIVGQCYVSRGDAGKHRFQRQRGDWKSKSRREIVTEQRRLH